ncbi:MAG: Holliday junction resolvase RuvX, partial [Actinomycetota bacterium]
MKAGVRIALDIGKIRTGIARSDLSGTIAFPHSVVLSEHLAAEIRNLITEFEPIVFYVGLPVDLQGRSGIAATDIRAQA